MKLAYLANIKFTSERAHALQIAQMCSAFAGVGIEITLFANKRSKVSKRKVKEYYKLIQDFNLIRLSHGIFLPSVKVAYYFSEIFFAANFLLRGFNRNFDILYSRQEWVVWFLSIFVKPEKLVWESHEAKLNFPARRVLSRGIKVVAISDGIFEDYLRFGVPKEQMIVAYDGIDESFLGPVESKSEARRRLGLPLDKKTAMYIGGFDRWKGVETFFAAAEHCKEVLFVAIGGTKEQMSQFEKEFPLVKFLGTRPYSELKDNQQAADVLIIPNTAKNALSASYTSPLKLFAHMASGVPLIVSDIPSLVSVTGRDLVTAATPDNVEGLSRSITEVVNSYAGKSAKAAILANKVMEFTWLNRAQKIKKFVFME
jgi:glycosyltransferase involved in cell wall biosynthesis